MGGVVGKIAARVPRPPQDPLVADPTPTGDRIAAPPVPLIPLTSFVGRARDLIRGRDVRLLTLTSPSGVGTSRLALWVAEYLEPGIAD